MILEVSPFYYNICIDWICFVGNPCICCFQSFSINYLCERRNDLKAHETNKQNIFIEAHTLSYIFATSDSKRYPGGIEEIAMDGQSDN